MRKISDSNLIKAYERCAHNLPCHGCPMHGKWDKANYPSCYCDLSARVLDLMKRQAEELKERRGK